MAGRRRQAAKGETDHLPFDQVMPRSLTASSIREYAPALPGVYGLSNSHLWIHIGAADNIQEALLGHLQQTDTAIMRQAPTGFVFEVCDRGSCANRQDRLTLEYKPRW